MKGKKNAPSLFSSEAPKEESAIALTRADLELLERLAEAGRKGGSDDLIEARFRRLHDSLHFALRSRFGSFGNAASLLLKRELGEQLGRKQILAELQRLFDSGAPVTLESLVLANPRLARATLSDFQSLASALEELGVAAQVAGKDRRWEKEKVFGAVLEFAGDGLSELSEESLASGDPFLASVVALAFGSFGAFKKEFAPWLETQPTAYLYWGKHVLSRMLLRTLAETTRGGKGKGVPDLPRIRLTMPAVQGRRLCMVTSDGTLYPVAGASAPYVSPAPGAPRSGMKLPSLERGERVVSFVSWGEEGGTLVMVSRAGRIKHLDLSTVKRLMSQGNRVMGLDEGDRLEAAAVMPPGLEQFLVVTRAGRGVVFDKAGIREQLSRGARGVLRIKSDEDGGTVEVAAILPVQPDCDLVLLGKNGKLLRLKMEAAPMRKAKTAGRRLWKVPVVGAAACSARSRLFVTTRKGRLLLFPASQVPMRTPNRVGVFGIRLESDDAPEMLAAI